METGSLRAPHTDEDPVSDVSPNKVTINATESPKTSPLTLRLPKAGPRLKKSGARFEKSRAPLGATGRVLGPSGPPCGYATGQGHLRPAVEPRTAAFHPLCRDDRHR